MVCLDGLPCQLRMIVHIPLIVSGSDRHTWTKRLIGCNSTRPHGTSFTGTLTPVPLKWTPVTTLSMVVRLNFNFDNCALITFHEDTDQSMSFIPWIPSPPKWGLPDVKWSNILHEHWDIVFARGHLSSVFNCSMHAFVSTANSPNGYDLRYSCRRVLI